MRIALVAGEITVKTAQAIRDYASPQPLFASGTQVAAHGVREIHNPGPGASRAMDKIKRSRADLT